MRAIFILLIFSTLLILYSCTTIEVAKEVTKASKSIKTSIDKIILSEEEIAEKKEILKEKIEEEKIEEEKTVVKQTEISNLEILGKTLNEIILDLGNPQLLRYDGKTTTARFDTKSCRMFTFIRSSSNNNIIDYYELRNISGDLVKRSEDIKNCFAEFKLT